MPPTSFARLTLENTTKIKRLMEVTDWNDPFTVGVMQGRILSWIATIEASAELRIDQSVAQSIRRSAERVVDAIPVPLPRVAE
jgi:hypothetical protein